MNLTVGVPAYNEAESIGTLLKAITSQKLRDDLSLSQILVVSDGSTDDTPAVVSNWTGLDSRIKLHKLTKRSGKATAINEIFEQARADIIVLMDADTIPIGDNFLLEMTAPFKHDPKVGIVAAVGVALPPRTLIGRAGVFSSNMRRRLLFEKPFFAFNVGLAVSTKAVRTLRLPSSIIGDDAYLFLKIKAQGLEAVVSPNAKMLYREPQTLADFSLQRRRYDLNVVQLRRLFGDDVEEQINAGGSLLRAFFSEMLHDMLGGVVWLSLRILLRLTRTQDVRKLTIGQAKSTKG